MENDKYDINKYFNRTTKPALLRNNTAIHGYNWLLRQSTLEATIIEDIESEPIVGPIGSSNLERRHFGHHHALLTCWFSYESNKAKL